MLIYLVAKIFNLVHKLLHQCYLKLQQQLSPYVSEGIGGVKELTSLAVILNAVVISALGIKIVELFKISNPIARGLALGTSGHTLGCC